MLETFSGPYVLRIDPIFATVGGVHLWFYGLSYSLGFLGLFLWLRRRRAAAGMDMRDVTGLTVLLAACILLGGRLVEVLFYEWNYYGEHLHHIPAVWLGGMSSHGLLLGAVVGTVVFCRWTGRSFLETGDLLAVAGAYILGVGRLGNFIDGQIVGIVTDVAWAVKFPDAEGFRHPVVLYDGLKNLLLVPVLILIGRRRPPRGVVMAHFILWYGLLRVPVDFFREYRTDLLGFPPGQEFNLIMAATGALLLIVLYRYRNRKPAAVSTGMVARRDRRTTVGQGAAFAFLLLFPLVIPSDWTQDVPDRYGDRHPGLQHSAIYPVVRSTEDAASPSPANTTPLLSSVHPPP